MAETIDDYTLANLVWERIVQIDPDAPEPEDTRGFITLVSEYRRFAMGEERTISELANYALGALRSQEQNRNDTKLKSAILDKAEGQGINRDALSDRLIVITTK